MCRQQIHAVGSKHFCHCDRLTAAVCHSDLPLSVWFRTVTELCTHKQGCGWLLHAMRCPRCDIQPSHCLGSTSRRLGMYCLPGSWKLQASCAATATARDGARACGGPSRCPKLAGVPSAAAGRYASCLMAAQPPVAQLPLEMELGDPLQYMGIVTCFVPDMTFWPRSDW